MFYMDVCNASGWEIVITWTYIGWVRWMLQNLPLPAAQEIRDSSSRVTPCIVMMNDGGSVPPSVLVFSWVHAITMSSSNWKNHCEEPGKTQEMNVSVMYGCQYGISTKMNALIVYTHFHKWLPEINKQKFSHPPKLQAGVAIGGVAVEAEFVHWCK